MDTNPDEEFSPNSYLLRACSGPQQASSSGKETVVSECVCVTFWSLLQNGSSKMRAGEEVVWGSFAVKCVVEQHCGPEVCLWKVTVAE